MHHVLIVWYVCLPSLSKGRDADDTDLAGQMVVGRYWRGEAGVEGCSHRSRWSGVYWLELAERNNSIIGPIIHRPCSGKGRVGPDT
jgi:hypothetical protein